MSLKIMNTKSIHSPNLEQQGKEQGTYWILEDTGEMYYDVTDNTRTKIRDIVPLENEITRLITTKYAMPGSFYYVIETGKLWFYNGNWIDMSNVTEQQIDIWTETANRDPAIKVKSANITIANDVYKLTTEKDIQTLKENDTFIFYAPTNSESNAKIQVDNMAPVNLTKPNGEGAKVKQGFVNIMYKDGNFIQANKGGEMDGTATTADVIKGKTFSSKAGEDIEGTLITPKDKGIITGISGEDIEAGDIIEETFYPTQTIETNMPTAYYEGCAFNPNGIHLAATNQQLVLCKRDGNNYTKIADPSTLPDYPHKCTFSPDGFYLTTGTYGNPYMYIYKKGTGDAYAKLANPGILPPNRIYNCAFSNDGNYLAVTLEIAPYIMIFKRSGDIFGKLADPEILPTNFATSVNFSPNGKHIVVTQCSNPTLIIYKFENETVKKLPDHTTLPLGNAYDCTFSHTGKHLAVIYDETPHITIYNCNDESSTLTTEIITTEALEIENSGYPTSIDFTNDDKHLIITFTEQPNLTILKEQNNNYTKLETQTQFPQNINHCALSSNNKHLALATSNNITLYNSSSYKKIQQQYAPNTTMTNVGYALENQNYGGEIEVKKIIEIEEEPELTLAAWARKQLGLLIATSQACIDAQAAANAKDPPESIYTDSSFALSNIVARNASAKTVFGNPKSTESKTLTECAALQNAILILQKVANLGNIEQLISDAQNILNNSSKYLTEYIEQLQIAVDEGLVAINYAGSITQTAVNSRITALTELIREATNNIL